MSSVLCFTPDPLDLFQDIRLDHSGKKISSFIDGITTLKDIIALTQLESFECLKTIFALSSIRMVEIKDECASCTGLPGSIAEEVFDNKIEEKTGRKIDPKLEEMIEDMHQRYERIGYYGVLGLKDLASSAEIKSAYYKAAKKYHPDIHFAFADDSLKAKLSDIFSYVYEAYATLSNPQKRREYDKSITLKPVKLTATQDKARAAFEEGKVQFRKSNFPEAEILFSQAAYYDRTISAHHYYYGLTLAKSNRFKDAEKAFERARWLEPANADYLAELGFIYLALGFPLRAKGVFDKALKISPGNARASEGMTKMKNN